MSKLTEAEQAELLAINKRLLAATAIAPEDETPESARIRLDYHEELAAEIEALEATLPARIKGI
ncbi:hypothetical protein ACH50O_23515 (plasmid) [Methylomonas sp. 2BW1-5-20]|uniref:hypothetical protein n=1 Tax=Methylomonas sp. 2BW1-5-20 TaxID=3376686 RepID=UPI00404EC3C0